MEGKLKHPKTTAFVLLLSAFMCSADTMTLQPILELLSTDVFPDAGYAKVSMIMNASAIALALISIATATLTKFGKKKLLLIGSILFAVGGLSGALVTNINYIIFTRIFEGLGAGLVMTVSLMQIPELFQDQATVDKLMGYNGIMMAVFSGLITFTSGYMALVNWKLPFLYYAVGFIIFILQWIFIPADNKSGAEENQPVVKSHASKAGILHALGGFGFGLVTSFFFVCISGVVAENGIGNASVAGTAATFNTVGSFISGFLFAAIFGKLKDYSFPCFYLCMILAFMGIIKATTAPTVFALAVLNGFGWNWFFSAYLAKVSMISDGSSLDANMAWANGAFYIGQFMTPFALSAIVSATGNESVVFALKCAMVAMIILAVIHLIVAISGSSKKKNAVQ